MTKKKPHPKRNPLLLYARAHTAERERERKKRWWCCRDHHRGARASFLEYLFLSVFLSFNSSLKIEIRPQRKARERRMEALFSSSSSSPPVALSAVFIVNLRGDVLIERQYRSDVTRRDINAFKTEILNPIGQRKSVKRASTLSSKTTPKGGYNNAVDVQSLPPVRVVGRVKFMFIRVANVYVCAATKLNVNAGMCFAFLKSAIGTFQVREMMVHHHRCERERRKMTNFFFFALTPRGRRTTQRGVHIKGGGFRCAMPRSRGSASCGECVLFFSSAR